MDKKIKNDSQIVELLKKTNFLLIIIIVFLFANTIISVINVGNTSVLKGANTSEQGSDEAEIPEYDVSKFSEVDYKEYKKLIASKGTHVIYIGRETCGYCAMFIPTMTEAQDMYGFKTYYFDITRVFDFENNKTVDQTAYDEFVNTNDFFKENFLATPMVVIFKDGKFVEGTLGYQEIDAYSQFLENNGFEKK